MPQRPLSYPGAAAASLTLLVVMFGCLLGELEGTRDW